MTSRVHVLGVCGSIGSGKSVVMQLLHFYGIPIYIADERAKMRYYDPDVRQAIQEKWGVDVIDEGGQLRKSLLMEILRRSTTDKEQLEEIVHSSLAKDFRQWVDAQKSPWVALESAILFTSGFYKLCDTTLYVTASHKTRKDRVMRRDGDTTSERFSTFDAVQRVEAEQALQSSRILHNDRNSSLIHQVEDLLMGGTSLF